MALSSFLLLLVLGCVFLPVSADRTKYVQLAEQVMEIRAGVLAWSQDPEHNARPIAELQAVTEALEADASWFALSQRAIRKRLVTEILHAKFAELATAASPEDLSPDLDATLARAIVELELLSDRPTLGSLFRLVIGS